VIRQPLRRIAFWLYVPALFTATHWPNLKLPATGRPDLYVHVSVFGTWTALLIATGYFGPPLSKRNIGICWLIAAAYSAMDEGLQAIPFVHRHAGFDDWGANMLGVSAAALIALLIARRSPRGTFDPGTPRTPMP
jgi:VanZ family protein